MNLQSILVVGGTGLLGIHFICHLKERLKIFATQNNKRLKIPDVTFISLDLFSLPDVELALRQFNPDAVINCAGFTNVDHCEVETSSAYRINSLLPIVLANACDKYKIPFVHISTDHLFDGTIEFADENHPHSPLNFYAKSKSLSDSILSDAFRTALVIRTNFFGWGTSYRSSFSDWIYQSAIQNKAINLFENVFITPFLVTKLVDTVVYLLEHEARGVFNISSDNKVSKYEFGLIMCSEFGLSNAFIRPCLMAQESLGAQRPLDMSLSNAKASILFQEPLGTVRDHIRLLADQQQSYALQVGKL